MNKNNKNIWVVENIATHKEDVWYSREYVEELGQRIIELELELLDLKEGKKDEKELAE